MFKRDVVMAAALCAFAAPALAAPQPELDALRAEFDQKFRDLQADYEARLKALEGRVRAAETQADAAQATAQTAAAEQSAQAAPPPASASSAFNPDISLILQGAYVDRAGGERPISGFLPAGEHAHAERGFTLDHTELVMSANVDPALRGYLNLAFLDEEAEVEEAWFQSLQLGHGLTVKGGRFLSGIGYQNEKHPHAWDFADNNLVYEALFGEHLVQDGVQLRWLAPTELFFELGAEVAKGQFFPGSDAGGDRNGAGSWTAFAHLGGDVGDSHSWRTGLSYLEARPREREGWVDDLNDVEALTLFSGDSKTWLADVVWKWAPNGNPRERNLTLAAEYFQRTENGDLSCSDNRIEGGACGDVTDAYDSDQSGWYAQAVYQFMPRWRAGTRYSRLSSGETELGLNAASLQAADLHPERWSLMTDFSPSEFSRFRLQYNRDEALVGDTDDQVILQYIMSLGPHGAHRF